MAVPSPVVEAVKADDLPEEKTNPVALLDSPAIANGDGLKLVELGKEISCAKSTLSTNANKGLDHFREWILRRTDGQAWTFEGEGDDRRFYRC